MPRTMLDAVVKAVSTRKEPRKADRDGGQPIERPKIQTANSRHACSRQGWVPAIEIDMQSSYPHKSRCHEAPLREACMLHAASRPTCKFDIEMGNQMTQKGGDSKIEGIEYNVGA